MSNGWNRTVSWGVVALVLSLMASSLASAQGRVSGKTVSEEGKGVSGLTLRFTGPGAETEANTTQSKKKGRFGGPKLRPGRYRLQLVDSDQFVLRAEFRMLRPDGLTVGEGTLDGNPRDGVVGVPVSQTNDVTLTIVVAPRASDAARERELAVALPALNDAADHYNAGRFDEAVAESGRIVALEPDLAEAVYVHGLSLGKMERHAEAEKALAHVAELDPEFSNIWGILGEVTLRNATQLETSNGKDAARGAYERAAAVLTEAARRDPGSIPLRLNLAVSLDRIGDDDRLLPVLEELLEHDPGDLPSRLRLASLRSRRGDHERALELLQAIPVTEKRTAVTVYNIAVRLNEEGDEDGSLLVARRATEIDPTLPQPRQLIAQLLLGKADHPAAMQAIREYLEVAPDDPGAATYRKILEQLGDQ